MTNVLDIKRAIEGLSSEELAELARWWNARVGAHEFVAKDASDAILRTSGCLAEADGKAFAEAVAAAGEARDNTLENC